MLLHNMLGTRPVLAHYASHKTYCKPSRRFGQKPPPHYSATCCTATPCARPSRFCQPLRQKRTGFDRSGIQRRGHAARKSSHKTGEGPLNLASVERQIRRSKKEEAGWVLNPSGLAPRGANAKPATHRLSSSKISPRASVSALTTCEVCVQPRRSSRTRQAA